MVSRKFGVIDLQAGEIVATRNGKMREMEAKEYSLSCGLKMGRE
jgi:hypothetical protein